MKVTLSIKFYHLFLRFVALVFDFVFSLHSINLLQHCFLRHAEIIFILELLKCGISLWGVGRVPARSLVAPAKIQWHGPFS